MRCIHLGNRFARRKRPRFARSAAGVIGAFMLSISIVSCTASPSGQISSEPGVLMRVEVSGPPVERNADILSRLGGDVRPSADLVRFASCHNVDDWLNDVTLRDNVAVSSNPLLVRVAELLEEGEFDPMLILAVETQFWETGQISFDDLKISGPSRAEFDRYAKARVERPSDAALERFVVYASTMTMSVQGITYLDTSTATTPFAQTGRAPTHDVRVVMADSVEEFELAASECVR